MKSKLIIASIPILIIFAGWWIYQGPRKEVIERIQWAIEEENNTEVPIFWLHYKWNSIEESDPTWIVFPESKKWWIVDLRTVVGSKESEFRKKST